MKTVVQLVFCSALAVMYSILFLKVKTGLIKAEISREILEAFYIFSAIGCIMLVKMLAAQYNNLRLRELISTDHLTGINNKRYFEKQLKKHTKKSKTCKTPFTLLLIDIDHFKNINDTHGHNIGDAVLKTVAEAMKKKIRKKDTLARIGGEEFAIILDNTDKNIAQKIAERFRIELSNEIFEVEDKKINLTISVGLAEYEKGSPKEFLEKVDNALYDAKKQGRNRVCEYCM